MEHLVWPTELHPPVFALDADSQDSSSHGSFQSDRLFRRSGQVSILGRKVNVPARAGNRSVSEQLGDCCKIQTVGYCVCGPRVAKTVRLHVSAQAGSLADQSEMVDDSLARPRSAVAVHKEVRPVPMHNQPPEQARDYRVKVNHTRPVGRPPRLVFPEHNDASVKIDVGNGGTPHLAGAGTRPAQEDYHPAEVRRRMPQGSLILFPRPVAALAAGRELESPERIPLNQPEPGRVVEWTLDSDEPPLARPGRTQGLACVEKGQQVYRPARIKILLPNVVGEEFPDTQALAFGFGARRARSGSVPGEYVGNSFGSNVAVLRRHGGAQLSPRTVCTASWGSDALTITRGMTPRVLCPPASNP